MLLFKKFSKVSRTGTYYSSIVVDTYKIILSARLNYVWKSSNTVIQNFGFPLPKHSGRQLLRKFQVQKFYPKFRGFEPKLRGFEPKFRDFEPKLPLSKHSGRQLLRKLQSKNFTRNFGVLNRNFGFLNWNFEIFEPKLQVFEPKLCISYPKLFVFENRSFVFLNQSCSFCKKKIRPTETSGANGSYEVSVERKLKKFSKFRAKINYCECD
jgi:hypothetical protein